jgi:hypothetical protein
MMLEGIERGAGDLRVRHPRLSVMHLEGGPAGPGISASRFHTGTNYLRLPTNRATQFDSTPSSDRWTPARRGRGLEKRRVLDGTVQLISNELRMARSRSRVAYGFGRKWLLQR